MSRRRYQEGSLKLVDGCKWEARWREDVLVNGKTCRVGRKQIIGTKKEYPTEKLAKRALAKILEPINADEYRPVSLETFGAFAAKWQSTVMIHHEPSGQQNEKNHIRGHLIPNFGEIQMREITAELVQAWASGIKLAPKTVYNIVGTFRAMWNVAKDWGYVTHDPFKGLRLKTFDKGQVYFFSPQEAADIIAAAKGWHKVFFRLFGETGLRPGEGPGLRPEDVMQVAGGYALRVHQTIWKGKIKPRPKNKGAKREFAISADLYNQIQRHIEESPRNEYGLIFVNKSGRPINVDHFVDKVLGPILDRLGITERAKAAGLPVGLNSFRHMNGRMMDQLGTPLKTRQKRLGHSDPSITLKHYTEAVDADDIRAAEQIGAMLAPVKEGESVQ